MEPTGQKGLERALSQKAMQMGNSTPCKTWVLGFFCGVCITYLFLVAVAPLRTTEVGLVYSRTAGAVSQNSSFWTSGYSITEKVVGSDEDNFPLTRLVQRDIWVHQHPKNCNDPNLRFLLADWERLPGFGIGAQLAGMSGLLAIAINEKRILVTDYYNRADHGGCQGVIFLHSDDYVLFSV
ncbi:hypothetical protein B296_00054990 [Ensete ventricosum]|uniref:Uncharacterized protein n=1 Tax=Ensete ventricosum TaxID=4639 RepID=A0A426X8E8_ENSVE|nr:hypothetical protein B296_00054990 [Ensete ventricosum]